MNDYLQSTGALLNAPQDLTRLLLHFNYCPAEYIHFTNRDQLNIGRLDEYVWRTKRALPPISAYILDQLRLRESICLDPTHFAWPLALLSPAKLKRLQQYIAAVLHEETIKLCLLSEDVLRWRNFLGNDAYKFALTGTKLLPNLQLKSYTNIDDAEEVSNNWIDAALSNAPDAISMRAKLKIPFSTRTECVDPLKAHRLAISLLSILEPKWHFYFLRTISR